MILRLGHHQALEATGPLLRGLARPVELVRRRQVRDVPPPLVLDHQLDALIALELMGSLGQGIAFVSTRGTQDGVVSADDLEFACDWVGERATVAHATTQSLIDLIEPPPAHFTTIEEA